MSDESNGRPDRAKVILGAAEKVGGLVEEYPLATAAVIGLACFFAGRRSAQAVPSGAVSRAGTRLARASKAAKKAAADAWSEAPEEKDAEEPA